MGCARNRIGMAETVELTVNVLWVEDDCAAFDILASVYRVPPHLVPILRTARETRREVKITRDWDRNIHAAELMPPPSVLDRFGKAGAWLRMMMRR